MSEFILYSTCAAVYFFGCGFTFGYLVNTDRDMLANIDSEMILCSTILWPISIWAILGAYLSEVWCE